MKTHKIYEDVIYYPNPIKENSYCYFPAHPISQTDTNGDPMISIVGGGTNWFLQTSAKWQVDTEQIDALAELLVEHELIKSTTDLILAPLEVLKVELVLKNENEDKLLASSKSSGNYPFNAAFNCAISETLQKEVIAAFHGKKETLVVNYHVALAFEYPVEMSLKGPIHQSNNDLNPESSRTSVAQWIEDQIQKEVLTITQNFLEDTPIEFVNEVRSQLIDKAVSEIHMGLDPMEMTPDESIIEIIVKESLPKQEAFITSTDISTWFKNDPNDHIRIIAY